MGRYEFSFLKDGNVLEHERCHMFIAEDSVSLVDPRNDDVLVVSVTKSDRSIYQKRHCDTPSLRLGYLGRDTSILRYHEREADRSSKRPLRQVIPGARPLTGVRFFWGYIGSA